MANHSYYKINCFDTDRLSFDLRYPSTLKDLMKTVVVERDIPDDVEIYIVADTFVCTVGELRREMERH